VKSSRGYR